MSAELMSGTALAREIVERCAERAQTLFDEHGVRPSLATVLVGDDPASVTYVTMKRTRSPRAATHPRLVPLPAESKTEELVSVVRPLSDDPDVHGILLQ